MDRWTAIYLRVSSKTQDTRSQEPDLKRWGDAQDRPVRWYFDKKTGKTLDRPGWQKLWADTEAGHATKIVVWRLDRLGRTAAGLTKLFEDLRQRGVGFLSLRDSLDLNTPAGRLMANVLASVASYETEVRSERQLAGIAAARAQGRRWGGSKAGRRITVTQEKELLVSELRRRGYGIAAISRTVSLSRPTIYRLLRSCHS